MNSGKNSMNSNFPHNAQQNSPYHNPYQNIVPPQYSQYPTQHQAYTTSGHLNKTKKTSCLQAFLVIIVVLVAIVSCSAMISSAIDKDAKTTSTSPDETINDKSKTKATEKSKPEDMFTKNTGWEKKVKTIASKKITPTEKYEQVMKLANGNLYTQDTSEFPADIAKEFMTGKYLSKPNDDVYMLSQVYKSQTLNNQWEVLQKAGTLTEDMSYIQQFTFDYYQNIKYVYRGVDSVTSEPVKSNEAQMWSSLAKIGKDS